VFQISIWGAKLTKAPRGDGIDVPSQSFNCVWFVDPTFPEAKSKVLLKVCMSF